MISEIARRVPAISPGGVVSAGGMQTALRSGSWGTIFGSNLASNSRDWGSADFQGVAFPTSLDGVSVSIGGQAAFIRSIGPGQINFQVPDGVGTGQVSLTVTNIAGTSAAATVTVANYAPAFFVGVVANSHNYVAATEAASGGVVYIGPSGSPGVQPAKAGDTLTLWGTGFGPTNPVVAAGSIFNGTAILTDAVQIFVDSVAVTPQFSGTTGAGLYQFNIVVPNVLPGDHTLKATIAGVSTLDGIWLATQ